MSLAAAMTLLLAPAPLDDEQAMIFDVLRRYVEARDNGDEAAASDLIDLAGTTYIADSRMHVPEAQPRPNQQVLDSVKYWKDRKGKTSFGEPTVLVRWNIAQIWVPYVTRFEDKYDDCGIANVSLALRWSRWRVTNMSMTREFATGCEELGMAEKAEE